MLNALTDFGDSAVLLPVATLMLIWLLIARSTAAGLWWLCALTVAIALTAVLKVYFFSCPLEGDLRSPSGHTGLSVTVYGGIAIVLAATRTAVWERCAICVSGLGFGVAIGVSRVLLNKHSPSEVWIGLLIGSVALAVFSIGYRHGEKKRGRIGMLIILLIVAIAILHGREYSSEQLFQFLSMQLQVRSLACR